ncbi:PPOX class F420-dependent oxidoreductase [Amycolatopsis sp. NEAU-NG30]|uniref:PPOX class F420-dependent oxidoreductase n=1 Tax=Amycolatopsis melonis TaxID=3156488 RepID=A0ABV0L819_9PSEU
MSRYQAIEFLTTGTRTGKLATASASGAPNVAPVWFTVDGDDVVFTTGRTSSKGRHLLANPRAALSVDSEEFPYSFVVVRGPVHVDDEADDLLAWNTRLAERYVPPGRAEEYGRRNTGTDIMLCRLRMEHVSAWSDIAS